MESASNSSACMLPLPGAFPFFRCSIASFISAPLGSDVSISPISSGASHSAMLTGLLVFSLLSTLLKRSYHLLVLLALSVRMLPSLSFTAALCLGLSLLRHLFMHILPLGDTICMLIKC